jgi:hypothetical protein
MSETPEVLAENPEEKIEVIESVGFVKEVKDAVNAGVTKSLVYGKFTGKLVDAKIEVRATSLQKAFDTLTKHAGELNKIRPKSAGFDEKMQPLPKQYTAEEAKKVKEIKEKVQRLDAAVKKALLDNATDEEWKKLDEAISKNG